MGLMDRLQALGHQLKLIEMAPACHDSPRKISTRIISLQELAQEIYRDKKPVQKDLTEELSVSFDQIFTAAGIQNDPARWTIERLRERLLAEPYSAMDRHTAQRAILEELTAENVSPEDLIKDAMARDQSLDAFENGVRGKMRDRAAVWEKRKKEIETRISELKEEADHLEKVAQEDKKVLRDWQQRKEEHEKEMTWAVEFLLERRQKERLENREKK
jgi:hypothetical protein